MNFFEESQQNSSEDSTLEKRIHINPSIIHILRQQTDNTFFPHWTQNSSQKDDAFCFSIRPSSSPELSLMDMSCSEPLSDQDIAIPPESESSDSVFLSRSVSCHNSVFEDRPVQIKLSLSSGEESESWRSYVCDFSSDPREWLPEQAKPFDPSGSKCCLIF